MSDPPWPRERTVVIGDTPRDIACARADGVRVAAVATGPFAVEALADADAVADDARSLLPGPRGLALAASAPASRAGRRHVLPASTSKLARELRKPTAPRACRRPRTCEAHIACAAGRRRERLRSRSARRVPVGRGHVRGCWRNSSGRALHATMQHHRRREADRDGLRAQPAANAGTRTAGRSGPAGRVNTDALSSDGTCTPASSMSWLPVARSPRRATCRGS